MNKIEWKYAIPLEDESTLIKFQIANAVELPNDLKKCIQTNNAAMPNKNIYDTPTTKERTMQSLLSFNSNDEGNVYSYLDIFKKDGLLTMVPFATDAFGNFLCVKNNEIVLWLHETETTEFVANSFNGFVNMLYSL